MRTASLVIVFSLFVSGQIFVPAHSVVLSSNKKIAFNFRNNFLLPVQNNPNLVDTAALKNSDWYVQATKAIEEREYKINKGKNTSAYNSSNRKQNLRALFSPSEFTMQSRHDDTDKWELSLKLKGVFAGKDKLYAVADDPVIIQEGNSIHFNHNNEFIAEYINGAEGIRQNFIIEKNPAGNPKEISILLEANPGWFINKVQEKEIHFAKASQYGYDKKITYNDLKVWDATGKQLDAAFEVNKQTISIDVNTNAAVYPVTIDPLSTGTAGTPDWIGDDADQAFAFFSISVASAGDVNGDGYSDVIIGASGYDIAPNANVGCVFVYHGSITGLSSTPNTILNYINQEDAAFGNSVASAGDVNGDGYSDVIIGAPFYTEGPNINEGWAFLHYGSASGLSNTPDSILDDADQIAALFGFKVASAGDVNGDGFSDVIIGAEQYDDGPSTNEGSAFVYHGSAAGLSAVPNAILDDGDQADCAFGKSVASAGDINGDGFSDVIVGAVVYDDSPYTNEGRAFVYYGSGTGLSSVPNSILDDADQLQGNLGTSVACAGDLNGDGYSDVVVGAQGFTDNGFFWEGGVFVYYGSATGLPAIPDHILAPTDQADAFFGICVASAGDVNGDGYSDIAIGASYYNETFGDEGRAFIYYGSSTGLITTPNSILDDGDQFLAYFGRCIASAGDVNGDGYSDVIISSDTYTEGANTYEGRSFVYHGSPAPLSNNVQLQVESNQANAHFGVAVASAGDVNGDGYSDVIAGAAFFTNGNSQEGAAFIFHGSATGINPAIQTQLECNQDFATFGFDVAGAGDVNGDGYSDVIVMADQYDGGNCAVFIYHGSASGINATVATLLTYAAGDWGDDVAIAAAGDVNGDGYGDVIIGSYMYDNGELLEGGAFIYHGSATGIIPVVQRILEINQAHARFGCSVAGAGDVNGDGFSDVIIGANVYDNGTADEGASFIYHGSPAGITPIIQTTLDCNQGLSNFGVAVASAGDVNGDGYGDVIISATGFDNTPVEEGAAFVFHGSATGITTTIQTQLESNQLIAQLGSSVASAGDVNGDGYSDVIVGARNYANGQSNEGAAFIYHGSPTGVSSVIRTHLEVNLTFALFGGSVACAGDVNGDGFSDVIGGARAYSNGQTNEGAMFIYHGNANGVRNNVRLYNMDLVTPIQQSSLASALFGAGLFAKSPLGRQKGKLVWETVADGEPFSGNPITNSTAFLSQQITFTDLGLSGVELKNQIAKEFNSKATYFRARVKYDPVTAITGQVYGPWRYPESFLRGSRDIGAVALPVKFIAFTATKQNDDVLLKWITTDETPGIYYEILHSRDGINFNKIGNITGLNNTHNEYEWVHTDPSDGKNYYRIRAVENGKETFTAIRQVIFDKDNPITVYPNPVKSGSELIIQFMNSTSTTADLFNMNGQKIKTFSINPQNNIASITLPSLNAGQYILKFSDNSGRPHPITILVY